MNRIDPAIVPWSSEAEQAVLGGLMLDNAAFERALPLEARHFFDARHAGIWHAIAALLQQRKPADVLTVLEHLGSDAAECGGLAYLHSLATSVPSAANVRRYAEIVREKAAQRSLIATADQALTIAGEDAQVSDKVNRIASMFTELQREQVRKVPRPLSEIAVERTAHYDALERGEVLPGWRTRIPALDRMLLGGVRPGGLYILAARPSVGKSSFSQAIGLNLAEDGRRVLFLSQEMSEAEVADRGVSNVGRISYSALLSGKLDHDGWASVTETMDMLGQMPFFVDDQPMLTLGDIRAKAAHVKPQVLILDYLQLCASTRKDGNRNSEIEEISRGLKALAKDLQIAVIALSQLNRDVEKRAVKRPNLSDLRDSGAIEQDADVVMFLWPVREFKTEGRRILGCGIDKNRQGQLGQFGLDFFGDYQRWNESTADISPDKPERKGGFDE